MVSRKEIGAGILVGNKGTMYYSTDKGQNWETTNYITEGYPSVWWCKDRFIAPGNSDEPGKVHYSFDGINWQYTTVPVPEAGHTNGQAIYVKEFNKFYIASNGTNGLLESTDGLNYIRKDTLNGIWTTLVYGDGKLIMAGEGVNADKILLTNDGENWKAYNLPSNSYRSSGLYIKGKFILSGRNNKISISTDGVSWSETTSPLNATTSNIMRVVSDNRNTILHYVTNAVGRNEIYYSDADTISWSKATLPTSVFYLHDITYCQDRFIASAVNNSWKGIFMQSMDGREWEIISSNFTTEMRKLCYA